MLLRSHFLIALFALIGLTANSQDGDLNQRLAQMFDSSDHFLTVEDRPDRSLEIHLRAGEMISDTSVSLGTKERYYINMYVLLNRLSRPNEAIPYLNELLEIMQELNHGQYTFTYFINHGRLAGAYKQLGQHDIALKLYREGIQVAKIVGDNTYLSSAINNLGLMHQYLGDLDSAAILFDSASAMLVQQDIIDTMLMASIRDNQANIRIARGDPSGAVDLLKTNYGIVTKDPGAYEKSLHTGLALSELYARLGAMDSMRILLLQLNQFLVSPQSDWNLEKEIAITHQWINYANLAVDHDLNIQKLNLLDSLRQVQLQQKEAYTEAINAAISNHQINKVERSLQDRSRKLSAAQNEAQQQRLIMLIVISFLLFVLISIFLFYRRKVAMERLQKSLKQVQLENERLEKMTLQTDLKHKEADFSNVMMQVALKEDWGKELSQQLEALVKGKQSVDSNDIRKLVREIKQQSGIHDKMELYQQGIADVNARFFSALESNYPELTKTEREVCGLIRLNLDGKEIATIRNIHPTSVRKMRQRIRKKLGIHPDQDLYQFVQAI